VNANASATLFGKGIVSILEAEARLKGFSEESLAGGFGRLVTVTHDSAKAYKDLGLAEDIARARGKDVETVSLAIAKAEGGQVTQLQRLIGVTPKYASEVAALTKQHEFLVNSGVKFSAVATEQYKQQLALAAATDATTKKTAIFALIQQQFGGIATHSGTAAAAMARFHVILHQVSVQVGEVLLPYLSAAATSLGHWLEKVRESGSAAAQAKQIMSGLSTVFSDISTVAHLVGPPLGLIAHALERIASVGGSEILGVAVAVKALGFGSSLAAAATTRLATVSAVYRGESVATRAAKVTDAEATVALTAALTANTAAMIGNAEGASVAAGAQLRLAGASATAAGALASEDVAMAAGNVARIGTASTGAAAGVGRLGTALVGMAGGPMNVFILAATSAALALRHFQQEAKAAMDVADEANSHVGTKNAAALSFYAERVKALMDQRNLDRKTAKEQAEKDTFAHTGIHVGAASETVAKALGQDTSASDAAKATSNKAALAAVVASVKEAKQTLASAVETLATAEQGLADAIRSGHQQIHDSIEGAMSNLASIGDTLASTIQEFLDKMGTGSGVADPKSAAFKRLRDEIASGHAAPGAARAASELANQIQQNQAVASQQGSTVKRHIADLVAEFNNGSITLETFNKRIAGELAKDGITYGKAGKILGIAFADGFKAQAQGLKDQAGAIAATPKGLRAGLTGQEPNIVKPLETIRQVGEQIAAAQRAVRHATLDVKAAQKTLANLEIAHHRLMLHQGQQHLAVDTKSERHLKYLADATKRKEAADRKLAAEAKARDPIAAHGRDDSRLNGRRSSPLEIHGIRPTPVGGP
jgi:hypothetical protein